MSDEKAVTLHRKGELMPQTVQDKMQLAGLLAKSGLVPQTLNTAEKVFVALQWGHELGLSPMSSVNNVVVINGKPTLSADVMYALAVDNPEYGGCEWKCRDTQKAEVVIMRNHKNGTTEKVTGYFDMKMAETGGLLQKENYKKWPDRMLRARALSRACKEAFPDVFAGLYSQEEAEDFDAPFRDVTEPPPKPTLADEIKAAAVSGTEPDAAETPAGMAAAAAGEPELEIF